MTLRAAFARWAVVLGAGAFGCGGGGASTSASGSNEATPTIQRGGSNAVCGTDADCPTGERCASSMEGEFAVRHCVAALGGASSPLTPSTVPTDVTPDAGTFDAGPPADSGAPVIVVVSDAGSTPPRSCTSTIPEIHKFPDCDDDGIANVQDNCMGVANADQADSNGNGVGDACESAAANCAALNAAFDNGAYGAAIDFSNKDLRGCELHGYQKGGALKLKGANLTCATTIPSVVDPNHNGQNPNHANAPPGASYGGLSPSSIDLTDAVLDRASLTGNWSTSSFVAVRARFVDAAMPNNLNGTATWNFTDANLNGAQASFNLNAPGHKFVFTRTKLEKARIGVATNSGGTRPTFTFSNVQAKGMYFAAGFNGVTNVNITDSDIREAVLEAVGNTYAKGVVGTISGSDATGAFIVGFGDPASAERSTWSNTNFTDVCFKSGIYANVDITASNLTRAVLATPQAPPYGPTSLFEKTTLRNVDLSAATCPANAFGVSTTCASAIFGPRPACSAVDVLPACP